MWKKAGIAGRAYVGASKSNPGDVMVDGQIFVGTEKGQFGLNHVFANDDGSEIVLNGNAYIDWLINKYLKTGMKAKIVYKGKIKLTGKKAGKETHDFDLFVADSTEAVQAPKPAHTDADASPPSEDDFSTIM